VVFPELKAPKTTILISLLRFMFPDLIVKIFLLVLFPGISVIS
jgi:hypothetical protein